MTRYLWIGAVALSLLALREANSSQPPVARTSAPFDNGSCGSCHTGGSPAPMITLLANGNPVDGTLGYVPGGKY
jgi:mono/diheme cytochrome c family protein